ncbi:MAG: YIP1 family protein [Pyrinomonadaceae bacterium]
MENNETPDWEPPPPPEKIAPVEQAEMSEVSTLLNIFMEPGRTFEDLRKKPRFLLGLLLICVLAAASAFALYQKVGETGVRRAVNEQLDKSPQTANMPADQRQGIVSFNLTLQKYMPVVVLIIVPIFIFVIGLFYFLGGKAFGGNGGFMHAVSVVVYSSIPPTVFMTIASIIVLAVKSADEIDLTSAQRGGLVQANPSMFLDPKAQPVLSAILSSIDVFQIWGWILAAIGLRITNKLSSGSAWAIVIIFALIGTLFKVVGAFFS